MARDVEFGAKPAHLMHSPAGGTRKPSEFDEAIVSWFDSGEWVYVPLEEGEDAKVLINEVKRAAALHNYGLTTVIDEENSRVAFEVRTKRKAGPQLGSKRDPDTGKMVAPGTDRYNELVNA